MRDSYKFRGFKINYNTNKLTDRETEIINKYWLFNNSTFALTQKYIIEKYNIETKHLSTLLVTNKAQAYFYCRCCDSNRLYKFETRKDFKRIRNNNLGGDKCPYCVENGINYKFDPIKSKEELRLIISKLAIKRQSWKILDEFEYNLFIDLLKNDFTKVADKYYEELGYHYYHKFIRALDFMEELRLIRLFKSGEDIVGYDYLKELKDRLIPNNIFDNN